MNNGICTVLSAVITHDHFMLHEGVNNGMVIQYIAFENALPALALAKTKSPMILKGEQHFFFDNSHNIWWAK